MKTPKTIKGQQKWRDYFNAATIILAFEAMVTLIIAILTGNPTMGIISLICMSMSASSANAADQNKHLLE